VHERLQISPCIAIPAIFVKSIIAWFSDLCNRSYRQCQAVGFDGLGAAAKRLAAAIWELSYSNNQK